MAKRSTFPMAISISPFCRRAIAEKEFTISAWKWRMLRAQRKPRFALEPPVERPIFHATPALQRPLCSIQSAPGSISLWVGKLIERHCGPVTRGHRTGRLTSAAFFLGYFLTKLRCRKRLIAANGAAPSCKREAHEFCGAIWLHYE